MVRIKKRYFVLECKYDGEMQGDDLREAIMQAVRTLHGAFGHAAIQSLLGVFYFNKATGIAFVGAMRGPHRFVQEAIPHINKIKQKPVEVRILHLTGSIRHGYLFTKKYQEKNLKHRPNWQKTRGPRGKHMY